jgi:hypothetical protein
MSSLATLAAEYIRKKESGGLFLEADEVIQFFIDATRKYAGYGYLASLNGVNTNDSLIDINKNTVVSTSEWAIISRLAELYCEKESALRLEATRGLGADMYGRTASEVASDITQYEIELPQLSYFEPCWTFGIDD